MRMEPVEDTWVFPGEDQEAGLEAGNSILGREHLVGNRSSSHHPGASLTVDLMGLVPHAHPTLSLLSASAVSCSP